MRKNITERNLSSLPSRNNSNAGSTSAIPSANNISQVPTRNNSNAVSSSAIPSSNNISQVPTKTPFEYLLVDESHINNEYMPWATVESNEIIEHLNDPLKSKFDIDFFSIYGKVERIFEDPDIMDTIGTSNLATIYKK
jgi:hypothetical protein